MYFNNINEANSTLNQLEGKQILNTSFKFNLKWSYIFSENKIIFVGNLNPLIDDISLFNFFKSKYKSVSKAKIIRDNNGQSKKYGFVTFKKGNDYRKSLIEMNGVIFEGNKIRVKEYIEKDENKDKDENEEEEDENESEYEDENKVKDENEEEDVKNNQQNIKYRTNSQLDVNNTINNNIYDNERLLNTNNLNSSNILPISNCTNRFNWINNANPVNCVNFVTFINNINVNCNNNLFNKNKYNNKYDKKRICFNFNKVKDNKKFDIYIGIK